MENIKQIIKPKNRNENLRKGISKVKVLSPNWHSYHWVMLFSFLMHQNIINKSTNFFQEHCILLLWGYLIFFIPVPSYKILSESVTQMSEPNLVSSMKWVLDYCRNHCKLVFVSHLKPCMSLTLFDIQIICL